MKILVIDDDLDLLKLIKNVLKKDYEVNIEDNVTNVDLNLVQDYDLILLDVMMPQMSGFDFLGHYRDTIDVPILLLTAKDFEEDKIHGFAIGADDYITKPFSIAPLLSTPNSFAISSHSRTTALSPTLYFIVFSFTFSMKT